MPLFAPRFCAAALRLMLALSFAGLLTLPARADTPPAAAAKEPGNLLSNDSFQRDGDGWGLPDSDIAYSTFVPAQAGPYRQAIHVVLHPTANSHPWDIALRQDVGTPLHKGDPLILKAWMRSPQSLTANAYVEQNGGGYSKFVSGTLTLTPDWKEYEVRGAADADYPTGKADAIFHLGTGQGVIEITGVRLFNPNAPATLQLSSGATPDQPVSLLENGDFSAPLAPFWTPAGAVQTEIVDAKIPGTALEKVLRLTTAAASPDTPWTIQLGQGVQKTVGRDEAIYFRAWMRSPHHSHVTVIYERAQEPNTKSLIQTVRLTPEWKEYRFAALAVQSFAPGESQFKFFVGQDAGVVEVAGVRVEAYGQARLAQFPQTFDPYGGLLPSDDWRKPALARIEKIRMGNLQVTITDARGKPISGASVRVVQTRQTFRWGVAAGAGRLVDTVNPNNVRMQQEIKRLYNTVVLENDLKWQNSDNNPTAVATAERAIDWLHANDIQARGHNLVWGSWQFSPAWLKDMTPEEERKAIETRVRDFARRFRGKVYLWDVVNEATNENDLWKKIGWEYFPKVYDWAREEDPNVLLAYNDYHALNAPNSPDAAAERQHIQALMDHHAPLDVIGEQAHLGTPLVPIGDVLTRLDALAKFGTRIEITELDLGVHDDAFHGRYLRDFLLAAFSHPAVDGIIQWGFWEGDHWRAAEGAAMFRRDWTKRPAELAYEDLVLHRWQTHVAGKTAASGTYAVRGFLGEYAITVTAGGKTKTIQTSLPHDGRALTVRLP